MKPLLDGITFDDVLLYPGYSDFTRSDIRINTKITKKISLSIPFVSAPMDTVTERGLAIALGTLGGLGIIHRNLTPTQQADEVSAVKKLGLLVGAAVGAEGFEERAELLYKAGADVLVVDSAHGFAKSIIKAIQSLKRLYPS